MVWHVLSWRPAENNKMWQIWQGPGSIWNKTSKTVTFFPWLNLTYLLSVHWANIWLLYITAPHHHDRHIPYLQAKYFTGLHQNNENRANTARASFSCVLSVHESKIEIVHFKTTFCQDVKHGSVHHYKKAQMVLWPNTCFISLRWATLQGIHSGTYSYPNLKDN